MENKVNLSKKEDSINLSKVEATNKVTISNSSSDLDIKNESRLISVMAGVSIFAFAIIVIGFGFTMHNAVTNKYSNYDDIKSTG